MPVAIAASTSARAVVTGVVIAATLAVVGGNTRWLQQRWLLHRVRAMIVADRVGQGRMVGQKQPSCGAAPACETNRLVPTGNIVSLVAKVNEAAADSTGLALYVSGLVDLCSAGESPAALRRAIFALESARERLPRNADLLNDLAVAYSTEAEFDQTATPLLSALDVIDDASRIDPGSSTIRFNRAAILQRLYLIEGAREAWSALVDVERQAGWRAAALAKTDTLEAGADSLATRFVFQRSRERLFALLGEWGTAIQQRRNEAGRAAHAAILVLDDSIVESGPDRTVTRTVAWFKRESRRDSGRVAAALADFGQGVRLNDAASYQGCEQTLARAQPRLRMLRSPLVGWAIAYRAACIINQARFEAAERSLSELRDSSLGTGPALTGKAMWLRGLISLRRGDYERASEYYAQAKPLFRRAREAANEAALSYLLAESLGFSGQRTSSRSEVLYGLRDLAPFRSSPYLLNLLMRVAGFARAEGLHNAARELVTEATHVGPAVNVDLAKAYVHWTLAEDYAATGDSGRAAMELDTADAAARRASGSSGLRARGDVALARSRFLVHRSEDSARIAAEDAIAAYRAGHVVSVLPAALFQAASLAVASRDFVGQRRWLAEAIDVIEQRKASFTTPETQAAYTETVENVFDAAIAAEWDAGHRDSAFTLAERARVMGDVQRPVAGDEYVTLDSLTRTLGTDVAFVEYAVLPRRVLVWYAKAGSWSATAIPADRDSIARLTRNVTAELRRARRSTIDAARAFDLLLRPAWVREAAVLAVVPDRELTALPFAALWNSSTGQRLVAAMAVVTAPSAKFVARAAAVRWKADAPTVALVVGSTDAIADAQLPALPGADAEARVVSAMYRSSTRLIGHDARRETVMSALSGAEVFHFAGHSVFDADRPERSYLALAGSNGQASGRIQAREIEEMRLSNSRVVVLSACRTLGTRPTHGGSAAGLSAGFIRAGTVGVVSTLWEIEDGATRDLIAEFHRTLQTPGLAPSTALRRAQAKAMQRAESSGGAGGDWAAFVYAGPWAIQNGRR